MAITAEQIAILCNQNIQWSTKPTGYLLCGEPSLQSLTLSVTGAMAL